MEGNNPPEEGKKDTKFQPGESGNPSGRPKGAKNKKLSLAEKLASKLMEEGAEDSRGNKLTYADAIVMVIAREAANGRRWAVELVMNYIDGRPVAKHEVELEVEQNADLLEVLQKAHKRRENMKNGTD